MNSIHYVHCSESCLIQHPLGRYPKMSVISGCPVLSPPWGACLLSGFPFILFLKQRSTSSDLLSQRLKVKQGLFFVTGWEMRTKSASPGLFHVAYKSDSAGHRNTMLCLLPWAPCSVAKYPPLENTTAVTAQQSACWNAQAKSHHSCKQGHPQHSQQ